MFLMLAVGSMLVACDDAIITVDTPSNANDSGVGNDSGDTDGDTGQDSGDDTAQDDTGEVVSGAISVSPSTLSLPTLFVGGRASDMITIANVGQGSVSVTLEVVGGWATSYTFDAYSGEIVPGGSAVHTLSLVPTTWGEHAVSVLIDEESSGGHVEVPVSAWVQLDGDGDGYGSTESGGEDCNDDESSINPGASDEWYDGVDSDCAGNDDYDHDGDGHQVASAGGDDCDDTDANVYAGAVDTWYDGIDSDCAGNNDFDQDADGQESSEYGGTDCADTDPAVYAGAEDAWYDGLDTDCAGNDDLDQDADGYQASEYGGDDCLDTDAAVYPGALDAWYDGTDADCAGDNDYDQDLDGVEVSTDCNDTDPTVTGPTAESFNGVDDDCDGLVDDIKISDIASGVLYGVSASVAMGDHGQIALGADVTGDGLTDLVVGTPAGGSGYGAVWVVDALAASTSAGMISTVDTAVITGDSTGYPMGYVNGPFQDVDGDGTAEVAVGGASTYYGSYARSYLFLGGATMVGAVSGGSYDARFSGDSSSYYGSTDYPRMIVLADLDSDGLSEVVIGSGYDDYGYDSDAGSVAIFGGDGMHFEDQDLSDADDRIYGMNDNDYVGMQMVGADINGDGKDDLVVGASGYDAGASGGGGVFVVFGADPASYDTDIDDAATLEIRGDTGSLALGDDTIAHPGDVDGDGALDIGLTSEASGAAWLFLSPGSSTGSVNVGTADAVFSGTAGDLGSSLAMDSDLDGDGLSEFVLGADGDDTGGSNAGLIHVFGGTSTWPATLTGADAVATVLGSAAESYLGAGIAGGADFDGDGKDDLAIGEPRNDVAATDAGAVWILKGW